VINVLTIGNQIMMTRLKRNIRILLAALAVLPVSASFAASISMSVSDSVSGTVASISDSFGKSSKSSTNAVGLTQGDYKITDIAVAEGRDNQMKIALQAPGDDRTKDLYLYLPVADYTHTNLNVGQIVTAMPRNYGLAFYQTQAQSPFAVVLADNWIKELHTNVVAL